MEKTADDQSPRGSQQSLQGPQEASPKEQTPGPSGGEGGVSVQIPTALYEDVSHLVERMGFANVADYVIRVLRDEVDRAGLDKGATGYTQHEIELIRKLLRDVECSD